MTLDRVSNGNLRGSIVLPPIGDGVLVGLAHRLLVAQHHRRLHAQVHLVYGAVLVLQR